jgi:HlyD family secretion protein
MQKPTNVFQWMRRQPVWRWLLLVALLAGAIAWIVVRPGKSANKSPTFAARRGPLEITVLEGGSIQALESQELKCEVRVGYQGTKILKIVEEGYSVSEDDVKKGKVLVELDSSELEKQIVQQEIQYQTAVASLIDAQQNYEIQLNQNDSDIKAAEQKVRFARMDFDKFLGDSVTAQIIAKVGLDITLAEATTNNVEETSRAEEAFLDNAAAASGPPAPNGMVHGGPPGPVVAANGTASATPVMVTAVNGTAIKAPRAAGTNTVPLDCITNGAGTVVKALAPPAPAAPPRAAANTLAAAKAAPEPAAKTNVVVDFSAYAKLDVLGDGEAKQKLRKFDDDLQVAQKELGQAKTTIDGTRRLFEKGFVTKTDLERDEIAYENSRLKVQTADTARDLFLKYDFLKSAEDVLSKYADAVREFDKARRVAISKAAQAKARLKSAQGQHEVQLRQRKDLNEQLQKCTLKATKPGLVVYGGGRDDMFYYGGEERIREGATVRERQAIITIPDMTRMSVNVKIHESYIKKVKKGQKARVTVDAFPDKVLSGEVTKVGVLPDSQNRWMNPDLKVYVTTITIDGTQDWLKPGMSAKVEILVNKLDNCVYVPMQAVSPEGEKQVCYVSRGLNSERREVQVGEFNDEFIELKSGISEGERVLLRAPEAAAPGAEKTPDKEKKPETDRQKQAPAPAINPAQTAQAKS